MLNYVKYENYTNRHSLFNWRRGRPPGKSSDPEIYKLDKAKQNMKEIFVNLESMNCEGEQVKLP